MVKFPDRAFLNERLTFRLNVLADEAISANDSFFVEETGCSIRDIRVLRLIDDYPGISFVEICKATRLERSLTSRIIQKLLSMQLVSRENTPGDARKYGLSTTAQGKQKRLDARALSDSLEELLLQPLSKQELKTLEDMLNRLAFWVRSPDYQQALRKHEEKVIAQPSNPRRSEKTGRK